jgi:hypothetical protein
MHFTNENVHFLNLSLSLVIKRKKNINLQLFLMRSVNTGLCISLWMYFSVCVCYTI